MEVDVSQLYLEHRYIIDYICIAQITHLDAH